MIWPLLVPWALILAGLRFDIGPLRYAAWNLGLIMLFTYGMQGVGIIQTLLERRNASRGVRVLITALLVFMLFWNRTALIVLVGLPCLGVSELWIHYRKAEKENENREEN
jgi:hypothetical protein